MVLRAGEYHLGRLGEAPILLGSAASGIELAAAEGEEAIITGGVEIRPHWRRWPSSDSILVADLPEHLLEAGAEISELLVGEKRMVTAREPDADVYNYTTWQGGIRATSNWGKSARSDLARCISMYVERSGLPG